MTTKMLFDVVTKFRTKLTPEQRARQREATKGKPGRFTTRKAAEKYHAKLPEDVREMMFVSEFIYLDVFG